MTDTVLPGALDNITSGLFRTAPTLHSVLNALEKIVIGPIVFNVMGYGALGDGVHDDTTAIQAAYTAAAVNGGVVFFPAGTYLISAVILYSSKTVAMGFNAATLTCKTGLSPFRMFQPVAAGVTDAWLTGLILDHRGDSYGNGGNSTPCVSINATNRVHIDLTFKNVQTMAVWADSTAGAPTTNPFLDRVLVLNSWAGGVSLFGTVTDLEGGSIHVENCQDDGFAIQQDANGTPARGLVHHIKALNCNRRGGGVNTPAGVRLFGCTDYTVGVIEVDGTVSFGVGIQQGSSGRAARINLGTVTIRNAGITIDSTTGVPGQGMAVWQADDVTIGSLNVNGSRQDNLSVFQSTRVAIGTVVANTSLTNGVAVEGSQGVTIAGFTAMNNASVGVVLISDGTGVQSVSDVAIGPGMASDSRAGGARTQQYGLQLAGSGPFANVRFLGVDFTNNVVATTLGALSTNIVFSACPGISPVDDIGWTAFTYANGWADFGSGNVPGRYRKQGGIVYVQGILSSTLATSHTVTTLPVGYRPAYTLNDAIVDINAGTVAGYYGVTSAGVLTVSDMAGAIPTNSAFFNFSFYADG